MNKDEVLERSRKETKNQDEMERDALAKAGQKACAIGGLVCASIIVLEAIFSDFANQVTFAAWAVYLSMTGTMLLVKYIRLKKKHELVFGILQLAVAAIFFVMYVIRLVR
jgi:hypothetical protein